MSSHPNLNQIDFESLHGLKPSVWILCDTGVSREAVKDFLFESQIGLSSDAVQDYQSICLSLLKGLVHKEQLLNATTREEVLRFLLRSTFREKKWHELRSLRHQKSFYKKCDESLQSLRMIYGSEEERIAQVEKLEEFPSELRQEVFLLTEVYENFLQERKVWDLPRLLLACTSLLLNDEIDLKLPEKIQFLTPKKPESRCEAFLEALSKRVIVERIELVEEQHADETIYSKIKWQQWHTLDDAAEALVDELCQSEDLSEFGILIPDEPSVRRSLQRALQLKQIPLKDPRDPTVLRVSEEIKNAFLPLRLAVSQFNQQLLIEFIQNYFKDSSSLHSLIQQIYDGGFKEGFTARLKDQLILFPEFLKQCEELQEKCRGKKTIYEWKEIHHTYLNPFQCRSFIEKCWDQYIKDLKLIGEDLKKRSLSYFLERMLARVNEAAPPVEKIQFRNGLELFRLGVTPIVFPKKLRVFGLPKRFTNLEEFGDYALSARDRALLSSVFLLRSHHDENHFRKNLLKLWMREAEDVLFLDAFYDPDGRERESISTLFKELKFPVEVEKCGIHPRFFKSTISKKERVNREIKLPIDTRKAMRASELESFSRCGFQGLLRGRWKLKEYRKSELELREDTKGILLHEAVFHLIRSRDGSGQFQCSAEEALNRAMKKVPLKGLFKSERLEGLTLKKCLNVLNEFLESEALWWEKARTLTFALEGPELEGVFNGMTLRARPDRVDEQPDGLWLIDYKTGASYPHGSETFQTGYRLQLPLYALLLRKQTQKEVLGYQIIELRKKGSRTKGLTIPRYYGKQEGALLQSNRKESASVLFFEEMNKVWSSFETLLINDIQSIQSGMFKIEPRNAKECDRCFARDACGERRFPEKEMKEEDKIES